MRTRAERLREIIENSGGEASDYTLNKIISLFKDCVPERRAFSDTKELEGFELCRNQMLKNLEEMVK